LRAGVMTEDMITEARGQSYEKLLRQRAENIQLKRQIAEEFEIDPAELGTLAKPGDLPTTTNEQTK